MLIEFAVNTDSCVHAFAISLKYMFLVAWLNSYIEALTLENKKSKKASQFNSSPLVFYNSTIPPQPPPTLLPPPPYLHSMPFQSSCLVKSALNRSYVELQENHKNRVEKQF